MKSTVQLLHELVSTGHELAEAITENEVPSLLNALRRRLGASDVELDLSPDSLKLLEARIVAYLPTLETNRQPPDEKETIRITRELAAYLGEVLVVNLNAEWLWRFGNLRAATVSVPIPVETLKNGELRRSKRRLFPAALEAAHFLDLARARRQTGFLCNEYRAMTTHRWKERL